MKKKVNEVEVATDIDTLNKIRGKLKPTDKVKLLDKKPNQSPTTSSVSTSTSSVMEDGPVEPEAVIEPKDKSTIKYLSNVKDSKSGEISKPFTIADKKYQMVRGITPSKEVVMAVYCHDDMDENGENIIHPLDYFEENIAKPMKEVSSKPVKEDGFDYASTEREHHDKEAFMDYLNLKDLIGYKHFFVNIKTGDVKSKFKNTRDMIKSGVKLGPDEDYMDEKGLKRFRFGKYFKNDVNEQSPTNIAAGTDVPKLQADVQKLVDSIKTKFSVYLSKLDKPIEQAQFLTTMAKEIGVPLNKLNDIITQFKTIATDTSAIPPAGFANENKKIITKNDLIESLKEKKVIKTVKVKDIK